MTSMQSLPCRTTGQLRLHSCVCGSDVGGWERWWINQLVN